MIQTTYISTPTRPMSTDYLPEILNTSFMVVPIAVEIFINITLYIRNDVIPVKLAVVTALMAIARKIIVFDYHGVSTMHVIGTALVLLAAGG